MDIKELQSLVLARWSIQTENPCHDSAGPAHALLHMMKAMGKLASAMNDAQHEHRSAHSEDVAKYLADLVILSACFAGDTVDLNTACVDRVSEKFPRSPGDDA